MSLDKGEQINMAVTVTYTYPVAGTTAPTALQALNVNTVIATVIATADADTTATITHNFGLSATQLASGFPFINPVPTLSQALTALSAWSVTSITANTVVLTKLASTGSGNASPQLTVSIQRPMSIIT
jgi:hypothetical protein